jgi:hypothetical protein
MFMGDLQKDYRHIKVKKLVKKGRKEQHLPDSYLHAVMEHREPGKNIQKNQSFQPKLAFIS